MVVSLYLIKHHAMTSYEEGEVVLHAFLTSPLPLDRFAPAEKNIWYLLAWRLRGTQCRSGGREE